MINRKIICLIGDNKKAIENHIIKLKEQFGDYDFCENIEDLKPMQNWIILNKNQNILKFFDLFSNNLLIISNFLYEIPVEIRIWAEIYIYNKEVIFNTQSNKDKQLWDLMFKKYKPKDINY